MGFHFFREWGLCSCFKITQTESSSQEKEDRENAEAAHLTGSTCTYSSALWKLSIPGWTKEFGKSGEKEGEHDSSGTLPLPVNHQAAEMVFADCGVCL